MATEVRISMKRADNKDGSSYWIGNSDLDFDPSNAVIFMYINEEAPHNGSLVFKAYDPDKRGPRRKEDSDG